MKRLFMVLVVVALVVAMAAPVSAQASKIALNIGVNLMLPLGTFGDAQGMGFGGTAQGEYAFMPQLSGTFKTGYIVWGGKDITTPLGTVEGGNYKGLPILVGGKYFFMPASAGAARFYGQVEIGLFFGSITTKTPSFTTPFGTFGGGEVSASSTDFVFSPTVGLEYPMGNGALDAGVNYFLIASSGSASNLGLRVGYKFAL